MNFLWAKAFSMLVLFHFHIARGDFVALYSRVKRFPVRHKSCASVRNVCAAVDLACIWYPKEVLCLQRSAATACLLKSCGIPAQLVVGARLMPFAAHA